MSIEMTGGVILNKVLMILEVSRKQDYIFSSRKLRENVARSSEIREVTESDYFRKHARKLYNEDENLVYSGGGHTVLQFRDKASAAAFARSVSSAVIRQFPDMELYLKTIPFDETKTPGENLRCLTEALERKKALRTPSFRWLSFGVEAIDRETWQPEIPQPDRGTPREPVSPPEGYRFPRDFRDLTGDDNFIAVIHIDGNAMGKRVSSLLDAEASDWDAACNRLRRFSEGVDSDYRAAFSETVETVLRTPMPENGQWLPIRPVILAGDDVCFVSAGSIGLECARIFLEHLTAKTNPEDHKPYSACAGVALVHLRYPFHMAYALSESLCSSAKRFSAALDPESSVSAMDWHIEFGQLKNSLTEIRDDYITEDGQRLDLRPVAVTVPTGVKIDVDPARTYGFFRSMCTALRGEYGRIARGKLKELRVALKQGETETEFYLTDRKIRELLEHVFTSTYRSDDERWERYREMLRTGVPITKEAFIALEGEDVKRSLFFDAIEMIDHFTPLEEVPES